MAMGPADDWTQCDYIISMMGGGCGCCSLPIGHSECHALHQFLPREIGGDGKREPVDGARWMKRDEYVLDIGWATFVHQGKTQDYRVGAENGFVILQDAEGAQARFREWEIRDVIDGLESLGQLPPPRFSHDGARARLHELLPELEADAIEAVIFAVRAGGALSDRRATRMGPDEPFVFHH